ncbi:unnamed protein product [marine sediment metagenome]|uniref:Uncharacterized protein n=1 Tax=marine sediment metagenome TaxID=412755 RepID=X1PCF9_9ZZZZ
MLEQNGCESKRFREVNMADYIFKGLAFLSLLISLGQDLAKNPYGGCNGD